MSTKISGMAAFSSPVLASDFLPVLHMPGGVPDATGPQRATLSQIRTAFMPVSLASEVTGALPVASLAPSATDGWVLTTTGGVPVWAAPAAGGGSSAGGSGQVQASDGAGGFTAPAGILAGSGFISYGANPATVGAVRLANDVEINARDVGNTTDMTMMVLSTTNRLHIGLDAGFTKQVEAVWIFTSSGGTLGTGSGINVLDWTPTGLLAYKPITGDGAVSPYGAHGMTVKDMAGATATLTGAEYANYTVKVTGTGTNVIKFPAATSDSPGAYTKYVWNAGSGTLAVQDTNSVAAAALLAAGTGATFQFSNGAVKQLTAAFTVA